MSKADAAAFIRYCALPPKRRCALYGLLLVLFALLLAVARGVLPVWSVLALEPEDTAAVATLTALITGLLLCYYAVNPICAWLHLRGFLRTLEENGTLTEAAEELSQAPPAPIVHTEHFFFSGEAGLICAYEDILWCYTQMNFAAMAPVLNTLVVHTADGKKSVISCVVHRKSDANPIGEIMEPILKKNPDILFGNNRQNKEQYKRRVNARRESK